MWPAVAALAAALAAYGHWWLGKTTYDGVCARCHGEDGAAAGYPNIKPLRGLTQAEARRRLPLTVLGPDHFFVRGYSLNRREVDALAAYIATLRRF